VSGRGRTAPCTAAEAATRLAHARAFLEVAELVIGGDDELATPQVAAALAVLSGIAASDATCCARLGVRSRGQDHRAAVDLLGSVEPHGGEMAKDLRRLLDMKDGAHYATIMVAQGPAEKAVGWARRLFELATQQIRP
jgi:hypothetical protein